LCEKGQRLVNIVASGEPSHADVMVFHRSTLLLQKHSGAGAPAA
jgi:hypothetical protein